MEALDIRDEKRAPKRRSSHCHICKGQGIVQVSHRILPTGEGMCSWHFRREPHPEEVKRLMERKQEVQPMIEAKTQEDETTQGTAVDAEVKTCACGCGRKLRSHNTTGYASGHAPKNAGGEADSSKRAVKSVRSKPSSNGSNGSNGHAHRNGALTVQVTPEVLDAIWASLSPEKKAALITHLSDI